MGDNPAPAVAPVPDAPAEVNATPTVPAGTLVETQFRTPFKTD